MKASKWCWAAVAISVARYYNPNYPLYQCHLATIYFGMPLWICCNDKSLCNFGGHLDEALDMVGHLWDWDNCSTSLVRIFVEIGGGWPIGVRIAWYKGGAHYVVITGFSTNGFVKVHDPATGGYSWVDYDIFIVAYKFKGYWTHSYYTTP